jgi:TonB family protein
VAGFSLAGRTVVGSWPRPAYDVEVEGRVVISITVNAAGAVTGAAYQTMGSTTNNATLREAARAAALRARFTPSEGNEVQTGTITYIFRLDR